MKKKKIEMKKRKKNSQHLLSLTLTLSINGNSHLLEFSTSSTEVRIDNMSKWKMELEES